MQTMAGPLYIASLLLVVAGAPKLARPDETARALRSVGLPGSTAIVRVLAVTEMAVGAYALLFGGRLSALAVAIVYLGFAGFVAYALANGGVVASCGCFGRDDTPPTWAHLILNLAFAGAGIAAAIAPVAGLIDTMQQEPLAGSVLIAFVALGTWFSYLILNVLPTVIPVRAET